MFFRTSATLGASIWPFGGQDWLSGDIECRHCPIVYFWGRPLFGCFCQHLFRTPSERVDLESCEVWSVALSCRVQTLQLRLADAVLQKRHVPGVISSHLLPAAWVAVIVIKLLYDLSCSELFDVRLLDRICRYRGVPLSRFQVYEWHGLDAVCIWPAQLSVQMVTVLFREMRSRYR